MIGAEESSVKEDSGDLIPSPRLMRETICVLMQSEEPY